MLHFPPFQMSIMSFLILSKIFTLEKGGQDYSGELSTAQYFQFDSDALGICSCMILNQNPESISKAAKKDKQGFHWREATFTVIHLFCGGRQCHLPCLLVEKGKKGQLHQNEETKHRICKLSFFSC